jgi:hypothetical protein
MWIGMFSLGTLLMFVAPDSFEGDGDIREMRRFFLGATIVGSVFIYWACMRVKRVQLAGSEFIISNYRKTIRIPVRDVEHVSSSVLLSPELIWLHLRRSSDFGSRIVFMPRQRFFGGFTLNPEAARLNKLLASPDAHA